MSELVAKILPLALIGAISPTVFLATVVILSGRRPLSRAWSFAAGVTATAALVALAGLFLGRGIAGKDPGVSAIVDLVVGILLLALAVVAAVRPTKTTDTQQPADGPARYGALFLGGFGLMATNFSSTMPLFVATKDIALAQTAYWEKVVLTLGVLVIILIPVLLPILLTSALPGQAGRVLDRLHRFLSRWGKWVVVAVFGVLGFYLAFRGLRGIG